MAAQSQVPRPVNFAEFLRIYAAVVSGELRPTGAAVPTFTGAVPRSAPKPAVASSVAWAPQWAGSAEATPAAQPGAPSALQQLASSAATPFNAARARLADATPGLEGGTRALGPASSVKSRARDVAQLSARNPAEVLGLERVFTEFSSDSMGSAAQSGVSVQRLQPALKALGCRVTTAEVSACVCCSGGRLVGVCITSPHRVCCAPRRVSCFCTSGTPWATCCPFHSLWMPMTPSLTTGRLGASPALGRLCGSEQVSKRASDEWEFVLMLIPTGKTCAPCRCESRARGIGACMDSVPPPGSTTRVRAASQLEPPFPGGRRL